MPDIAASSSSVDLSSLPAPTVIEQLSFDTILAANLAQAQALIPGFDATVASDPVVKLVELFSYGELLIRQDFNDRAHALMTAYATGADLDQIALRVGVFRQEIDPGNPDNGVDPILEDDASLRQRIVLAPESFTCAGPELAYVFHAKSAHPDVLDASASSPAPGEVLITLLSRTGDGTAPAETIAAVEAVLTPVTGNRIRPMGDLVTVASAEIIDFAIDATIYTFAGPDHALVLQAARERLDAYLADSLKLARDITDSSVKAALSVAGVQRVVLPGWADIVCSKTQAARCTGITLAHGGYDE
ncbi:baseplate assembly protein [Sphingomonas sp.]|uniref:baseplate assembly protein n=1 Tax=Sphingomonas sp. TaxID=28214 RepID=UPI002EDB7ED6